MTEDPLPALPAAPPAGRRFAALAGVFAAALAVRLLVLHEISASPAWGALFLDSEHYDRWARAIAAGDWVGEGVFFMAPLYPYVLGAVYAILGPSLPATLALQAALGAAACVFLATAGRSLFSPRVGAVAGLLLALSPAAVFSDTLIQKSVLDVLLTCLLLAALAGAMREPGPRRWLLAGLAAGGLALTRENALAFLPLLAACAFLRSRGRPPRSRAVHVFACLLGAALALAPVAARNRIVGGEAFLTTSQFGYNLYIGNGPRADGTYTPLVADRQGREQHDARELAEAAAGRRLSAAEVSRHWRDLALRRIAEHPGWWLSLLARKMRLALNALELPDAYDQYAYGDWSVILRWLTRLLHFGVLAPLAAAGIVVTWDRRGDLWPLHGLLALYAATLAAFFVLSRYRLPLVPLLALFAAAFLVWAAETIARGATAPRSATAAAAALAAGALLANWPLAETAQRHLFRATFLANLGSTLVREPGRSAEAARALEEALRLEPRFGPSHYYLGLAYKNLGRLPESLDALRRSATLLPEVPDSFFEMGNVFLLLGRPGEAVAWHRRALAMDPDAALWQIELARSLHASGDPVGARDALGRAGKLGAADPSVRAAVIRTRAALGLPP